MAETTNTIRAAAITANGTEREPVALPADLFDGTVNMPVLHQAVKAFLANRRQGNAMTKTRGLVEGGNQKPWKQKGTGRARQGSIRAPNWVGGGTVFGPIPRSYAQYVPRQVRALARKSALNARARENAVMVVDRFEYERPQTSRMAAMLDRLSLGEKKVLVLTDGVKENVYRAHARAGGGHGSGGCEADEEEGGQAREGDEAGEGGEAGREEGGGAEGEEGGEEAGGEGEEAGVEAQEEGEVTHADIARDDRPSGGHGEEFRGLSGARRIHVPGASEGHEA